MSFITTSAKEVTTSIRHGRQGVVSFVTMSGKEITAWIRHGRQGVVSFVTKRGKEMSFVTTTVSNSIIHGLTRSAKHAATWGRVGVEKVSVPFTGILV